ncbi:MAG: hypothetical protein ABF784_05125, partial [Oenococcus oeni]
MSYTINENTFDETEDKANQLHDLMFIFANNTDLDADNLNLVKQEDVLKLYGAYQYISSISGCMVNLIDDIYKNTHK